MSKSDQKIYEVDADNENYINLFYWTGRDKAPAHYHNSVEIGMITAGTCKVRIGENERILSTGDIFFVDKFEPHSYDRDLDTKGYVAVISENFLNDFRAEFPNRRFSNFLEAPTDKNVLLSHFMHKTYEEWGGYNLLLKKSFANGFLGYLVKYYPLIERNEKGETAFFVSLLRYIDENFSKDLTAKGLAEQFGYTPNYFSTLFHRYLNTHFRDFLNSVRLKKMQDARKRYPDIGVIDLAWQCGFSSPNTYYRAMKKFS